MGCIWEETERQADRKTINRAKTTSITTDDKDTLYNYVQDIFKEIDDTEDMKLLGVSFRNLAGFSARQLSFKLEK